MTFLPWLIYAVLGFGSVVFMLMMTGHAVRGAKGAESQDAGCWDERVHKLIAVLGGAASFSFGWPYFAVSLIPGLPGWFGNLVLAYGSLQFVLSCIQTAILLVDTVRKKGKREFKTQLPRLKAHWGRKFGKRGCGSSTARSPLWFLYWASIPFSADSVTGKIIGVIRDAITLVDFLTSLPAILVIDVITLIVAQVAWFPTIESVDQEA